MAKKTKSAKKKKKIAIVVSRFNGGVTEGLLSGALGELKNHGVNEKDITVIHTPGAFEIPLAAKKLCSSKKYSAVICLGAVIKGETAHFEYISYAVTKGIMQVMLEHAMPVSFGVLTAYSDEQAIERSKPGEGNKGAEAARAALEMMEMF
jgi:6,7-dimethyl-8-ribityllumazine synthase